MKTEKRLKGYRSSRNNYLSYREVYFTILIALLGLILMSRNNYLSYREVYEIKETHSSLEEMCLEITTSHIERFTKKGVVGLRSKGNESRNNYLSYREVYKNTNETEMSHLLLVSK